MNKALTVALYKGEIKTMMTRIAKCDRRIAANILGVAGQETENERKQRLLGLVATKLQQISIIEKGEVV